MRKIPLLVIKTEVKKEDGTPLLDDKGAPVVETFSYPTLLESIIRGPAKAGEHLDVDTILRRAPVLEKLRAAVAAKKEDLLLEDEEWRNLRDAMLSARFPFLHDRLASFLLDIKNAPALKAKEVTLEEDMDKKLDEPAKEGE